MAENMFVFYKYIYQMLSFCQNLKLLSGSTTLTIQFLCMYILHFNIKI